MVKQKKRKHWLIPLLFLCLVVCWWYNTYTLQMNHVTIEDEKIQDEITICQISDLHGASFGNNNQLLIDKIARQNPDLIAVTGDMYTNGDSKGAKTALKLMTNLTAIAPVYFVNGEHDNDESFFTALKNNGIHVLNYDDEIITIKNTTLHLYGTNSVYYTPTYDLHHEWETDPTYFNILLAHIANFDAFREFGIDLSLCGDTHGGQVRLPRIGAIYTEAGWFPDLNGAYVKGLYEKDDAHLYVSSGLGNYPIPLRLFNRPEIAVITLKGLE